MASNLTGILHLPAPIGGYRAMPATGDRHAARLVFQSASVLADSALSINDGVLQPNGSRTALFWAADIAAVPPGPGSLASLYGCGDPDQPPSQLRPAPVVAASCERNVAVLVGLAGSR